MLSLVHIRSLQTILRLTGSLLRTDFTDFLILQLLNQKLPFIYECLFILVEIITSFLFPQLPTLASHSYF